MKRRNRLNAGRDATGEPAYGDPDYHSSSDEEDALELVARTIGATDAIGYFRDGASTIVVRFPAGSATDILPSTIGGFEIIGTNSRFISNTQLQATLGAVLDAVTAVRRKEASGSWSYDVARDAVVVSGSWGQDVLDELNLLPGVDASFGEIEAQ